MAGVLRTKLVAAIVLMPFLLGACDSDPPARGDSAAAEIIDNGYAAAVEVSGARQVLVAYVQPPEDDEGTYHCAWRLYDESGDPVGDGRGSRVVGGSAVPTLWPLPDGFLMSQPSRKGLERIDREGAVSPVAFVDRSRPTRAGDVLVTEQSQSRARFYRPADDTTYRVPELPQGVDNVAIDARGGVWVALGGADDPTMYSSNGRPPWRELAYDLPPGSGAWHLEPSGDVMLLTLLDNESSTSSVSGLLAQDIDSPGRWDRIGLNGVDSRRWSEPEVGMAAPGRVLLGDWGPRWYVGANGDWARIALPDPEKHEDFLLEAKGGRIYARSTQHSGLRWSDDLGGTWHNFAP